MTTLFRTASLSLTTALLTSQIIASPVLEMSWQANGFEQPESVLASPDQNWLYVSNIKGHPLAADGDGYITRLSADGSQRVSKWAEGMDAPKGMAIYQDKLYVADLQQLHVIDTQSGRKLTSIFAKEAKMLNDVTVSNEGQIFVSDLLTGQIYTLNGQQLDIWMEHPELSHPNGLLAEGNSLLVADWGTGMKEDFTTSTPGTLYRVDLASQSITAEASGYQLGNLDGIVKIGDAYLVSDWISGALYYLSDNERIQLKQLPSGLADIGSQGDVLYAPFMMDNKVAAYRLLQQ